MYRKGERRRNLRTFDRISGFLRIYVLIFHLKVTKLFVLQHLWLWIAGSLPYASGVTKITHLVFMDILANFYPSPLHNGTFCTGSIHFNNHDNGAFIFIKVTIISWSLAICVIMIEKR